MSKPIKRFTVAMTDEESLMIKDLIANGINISYHFRKMVKDLHDKIDNKNNK